MDISVKKEKKKQKQRTFGKVETGTSQLLHKPADSAEHGARIASELS